MSDHPMSINLALIVAHLMTHPRGWRVDQLKQELGIADRTYRKYRKILIEEFPPFQRRDGSSSVLEIEDGRFKYLRIVTTPEMVPAGKTFSARVGALYLARSAIAAVSDGRLRRSMDDLVHNFTGRLQDRYFALNGPLKDIEAVFPVAALADTSEHLEPLIHAAVFGRSVWIKTSVADYLLRRPKLYWRRGQLVVAEEDLELPVRQIRQLQVAEK